MDGALTDVATVQVGINRAWPPSEGESLPPRAPGGCCVQRMQPAEGAWSIAHCLSPVKRSGLQTGVFLPLSTQTAKWEQSNAITDCLLWKHATFSRFTSSFVELLSSLYFCF